MSQFLQLWGTSATFTTAAGVDTAVTVDFREQMSAEKRDRRGARLSKRLAVAHIQRDEVAAPTIKDTLTVDGEVWHIAEVNPETTSHRLDLVNTSRLERSGGSITEGRA